MVLRLFLFSGLLLHKLVWEVMKRRGRQVQQTRKPLTALPKLKALVKLGKIGVLGFLLVQTLFLRVVPILKKPRPLQIFGAFLFIAGLATAIAGRLKLGSNWVDLEDYQVGEEQSLVTDGIYRYIRHPIYAGDLLLLAGLQLALNSWLVLGVPALALVVLRQVKVEEQILEKAFADYKVYQQKSSMLIPFVL